MDPSVPAFWDTLACNLVGAKSDSDALQAFRKAISLKKRDRDITWDVFKALCERMGLHEDAVQAEKKIRESETRK